jgi:hypothetical protein
MFGHRKWIKTLGVTIVLLLAAAAATDMILPRLLDLRHEPLDKYPTEKVQRMLIERGRIPDVLIAGDSRTQRQIIPDMLGRQFGVDVVNLGVAGGELVSIAKTVRRYSLAQKRPLLIISVSSSQVNDGVPPMPLDDLMGMPWIEQAWICRKSLPEMAYRKIQLYSERARARMGWSPKRKKKQREYIEDGFVGIETVLDVSDPKAIPLHDGKITHPWYQDLSQPGSRWRVFQTPPFMTFSTSTEPAPRNPPRSCATKSESSICWALRIASHRHLVHNEWN